MSFIPSHIVILQEEELLSSFFFFLHAIILQEEKEPLKAMLEIMTKHFMECSPHSSVQHMKECESSQWSVNGCQLDISYSHKANQLTQPSLTKRSDATSLATKRGE